MSILTNGAQALSRLLQRFPRILFGLQRWWLRVAYDILDLTVATRVIRRPEWLRIYSKPLPSSFAPRAVPDRDADEIVAARLISSYCKIKVGEHQATLPPLEDSMWGDFLQSEYATLRNLVEEGDTGRLARYLSTIFRSETVNGYTFGNKFDRFPHRWWYLPIGIELSAITLAESIGIVRAECPEQGQISYWRSEFTEERLIEELESFFSIRIEAPRTGDARGVFFGGRFLTLETCSQLYTAYRMREAINGGIGTAAELNIVEIGGGYGGLCYWMHQLLGTRINRYVIVDLPEVNLVQAYFLSSLKTRELTLFGEATVKPQSRIELIPHWMLSDLDWRPNVLINQDSMPEMPEAEVARYLSWGSDNVDGLFLSFNQEAFSPWRGIPQVHVPSIISRYPRFRRLSRNPSWVRRGYVEEIYSSSGTRLPE
jgi:hypothetical protein